MSTDLAGNTATATGTIHIDTENSLSINTANVETDGTVNGAEASDGVTLTGTAEAGATVVVTLAGVSQTVVAGSNGTWSATWTAAQVPTGELDAPVTATSTDAAGNTQTVSGTINIDTFVNNLTVTSGAVGGDGVVNFDEYGSPITITGTVEAGSSVVVTLGGVTLNASVASNGSWTVTYPAGSLPAGEYTTQMVVNATDAAGNTTSMTESVLVDTVAGDLALSPYPIEVDDVVNAVEAADGVVISGTATPGLTVTVTLGGVSHQVVASQNGTWSSTFLTSEIPAGTYDAPITASITDAAGNHKLVTDSVHIDTQVDNFAFSTNPVEGDDIVSKAEAADGVVIRGTVEPGSFVVVTMGGVNKVTTAGSNGTWSVTFSAAQIASGEYDATITAKATDIAGNTKSITDTFIVDTVAPDAPEITSIDRGTTGLRSIGVSDDDTSLEVFRLSSTGEVTEVGFDPTVDSKYHEVDLDFDAPVPNGSTLVISSTDASGNQSGTLFVYDQGAPGSNAVDRHNPGLDGFNIGSVDLNFAEDATLTLTEADLVGLSDSTNTLTIHGGVDDTVTMIGAQSVGTSVIDGQTYDIYSLGDDGTVIINEDINIVI